MTCISLYTKTGEQSWLNGGCWEVGPWAIDLFYSLSLTPYRQLSTAHPCPLTKIRGVKSRLPPQSSFSSTLQLTLRKHRSLEIILQFSDLACCHLCTYISKATYSLARCMADYMPNHRPFSNPHSSDFLPNPPPDQVMFSMDNTVAQCGEPPLPQIPSRPKSFARAAGDYRERNDKNGNGTVGMGNGKPFPTPLPGQNAYNHRGPRDYVGGAAIFRSKSPPTKSMRSTSPDFCWFYLRTRAIAKRLYDIR